MDFIRNIIPWLNFSARKIKLLRQKYHIDTHK